MITRGPSRQFDDISKQQRASYRGLRRSALVSRHGGFYKPSIQILHEDHYDRLSTITISTSGA